MCSLEIIIRCLRRGKTKYACVFVGVLNVPCALGRKYRDHPCSRVPKATTGAVQVVGMCTVPKGTCSISCILMADIWESHQHLLHPDHNQSLQSKLCVFELWSVTHKCIAEAMKQKILNFTNTQSWCFSKWCMACYSHFTPLYHHNVTHYTLHTMIKCNLLTCWNVSSFFSNLFPFSTTIIYNAVNYMLLQLKQQWPWRW
jgi:hypothetical protein